ncbi:MAG: hypothetical protein ACLFRG_15520 [Desulfococcaceae bacterium]
MDTAQLEKRIISSLQGMDGFRLREVLDFVEFPRSRAPVESPASAPLFRHPPNGEAHTSPVNAKDSSSHENGEKTKRRTPPPSLAGRVKIHGDIVSPIVDEADWECLRACLKIRTPAFGPSNKF